MTVTNHFHVDVTQTTTTTGSARPATPAVVLDKRSAFPVANKAINLLIEIPKKLEFNKMFNFREGETATLQNIIDFNNYWLSKNKERIDHTVSLYLETTPKIIIDDLFFDKINGIEIENFSEFKDLETVADDIVLNTKKYYYAYCKVVSNSLSFDEFVETELSFIKRRVHFIKKIKKEFQKPKYRVEAKVGQDLTSRIENYIQNKHPFGENLIIAMDHADKNPIQIEDSEKIIYDYVKDINTKCIQHWLNFSFTISFSKAKSIYIENKKDSIREALWARAGLDDYDLLMSTLHGFFPPTKSAGNQESQQPNKRRRVEQ